MRTRRLWLNIIAVAIVIICSAILGTMMNAEDNSNELMIAVVSLGVALIALYISLRTFYSIDEVNAISRMDGNVMENPRYQPNILRAVFRFSQIGFTETSEALMSYMEQLFSDKSKQSGAHLADDVQEIADLLVLIPYFIKDNSAVQQDRVSALLATIRHKVDNFKEISDGSCKLLEETVCLIDSVFAYQRMNDFRKYAPPKLLEIRGSIFINPVTRVLYYDYLGLYFLRRAFFVISGIISPTIRETAICIQKCTEEEKSMALVYSSKASESFKRANDNIGDDMIWEGYLCFNIARAEYLNQSLKESFGESTENVWEPYIDKSIRSWMTSNKIVAEHFSSKYPNREPSWLQRSFKSEEDFVRLSKIVMQILKQQPLTDYNGNVWLQNFDEVAETSFFKNIPQPDPQKLTDRLIADIIEFIKSNK